MARVIGNLLTYIASVEEINNKNLKLKFGRIVRISKCKRKFAKSYAPT